MALIRWEPFRELETLSERMRRLFREGFSGARLLSDGGRTLSDWVPECDISEDLEKIEIRAALPGMDMKDISVQVEENVLTISGERKEEKRESKHRTEWYYGSFCRSFTLPTMVHDEQAKAAYDRGVLTVTLPKKKEGKSKQLKIDVN